MHANQPVLNQTCGWDFFFKKLSGHRRASPFGPLSSPSWPLGHVSMTSSSSSKSCIALYFCLLALYFLPFMACFKNKVVKYKQFMH
jgi:hypothetical protein